MNGRRSKIRDDRYVLLVLMEDVLTGRRLGYTTV